MADPFWLALAAKILIASAVVVSASLVAQRTSPFISAMIATLPVSAGPNIAFLAYDHGASYLAGSMIGTLAAMAATGLYFTGYALTAQRYGYWPSIAAALAGWLFFLAAFDVTGWTIGQAWLALLIVFGAGSWLTRHLRSVSAPAARPRLWYEIPLRVAGVAAMTGLLAWIAQRVSPGLAGYVAAFPVVFTSLTFILHHSVGGRVTAAVVANSFSGLFGFAVAQTFVYFTVTRLGSVLSLLAGLLICILWNLALIMLRQRGAQPAPA